MTVASASPVAQAAYKPRWRVATADDLDIIERARRALGAILARRFSWSLLSTLARRRRGDDRDDDDDTSRLALACAPYPAHDGDTTTATTTTTSGERFASGDDRRTRRAQKETPAGGPARLGSSAPAARRCFGVAAVPTRRFYASPLAR